MHTGIGHDCGGNAFPVLNTTVTTATRRNGRVELYGTNPGRVRDILSDEKRIKLYDTASKR